MTICLPVRLRTVAHPASVERTTDDLRPPPPTAFMIPNSSTMLAGWPSWPP
ncbi:hypothetical protein JCM18918_211 [Cutibacterium acnes JCM 18918]|nr:hypothetical protein JCM18918_211 [Cutibacterium acnes JCM 18918]